MMQVVASHRFLSHSSLSEISNEIKKNFYTLENENVCKIARTSEGAPQQACTSSNCPKAKGGRHDGEQRFAYEEEQKEKRRNAAKRAYEKKKAKDEKTRDEVRSLLKRNEELEEEVVRLNEALEGLAVDSSSSANKACLVTKETPD